MALICKIGNTDYGPSGANILATMRLTPATHDEVGTALIRLQYQGAGAYTIGKKQQVWVYETGEAGNITHRWFAGFVARVRTTIDKHSGFRTWLIYCQDWNVLLDRIVGRASAAHAIRLESDTFDHQIAGLVTTAQSGASAGIDAASGVANLTGLTVLPEQVFRGMSLRMMIAAVCEAAQRLYPDLRPRFYLGYDTAVTAAFGLPVLNVYDHAVAGMVASWSFSDDPGAGQYPIYGTFARDQDATELVNYQQTYLVNNGLVSTGQDAASIAAYPNPYSAQNAWAELPMLDRWSQDTAEAQAFADSLVAETAQPWETISFDTDRRVLPGQYVDVTAAGEGLSNARYLVIAVDWDFTRREVDQVPWATLTLGERKLGLDEHAVRADVADLRAAPVFHIRHYGAFADGSSDDGAAINAAAADAAWAGGGVVDLGSGRIVIGQQIVLADGVHLRGHGPGATVLDFSALPDTGTGDPCILASGSLGSTIGALAGAVPRYSNSLSFTGDVGLAAGDVLLIYDPTDYSFSTARANYRAGEYVRVISYDVTTFTATLACRTHAAYDAAVQVYKPAAVRVSVKHATLKYKYGYRGIKVELGQSCSFRELAMSASEYSLLELNRCFESDVNSCVGIDSDTNPGSLRYGLAITNSQRVAVTGSVFETRRHGLVTGGDNAAGSIPVRELVVVGCTIGGTNSTTAGNGINGFDLHGNSEHVILANCNLPNGATLAGDHVLVQGCVIRNGAGNPIYLTETLGFNFHFVGNQVFVTHNHPDNFAFIYAQFKSDYTARTGGQFRFVNNWVHMGSSTNEDAGQSTIGLYLYNVSGPANNSVLVEGNTFHSELTSATGGIFGAYIRAFDNTGLREVIVRNNTARRCGLRTEGIGGELEVFEGNTVHSALDRGIMIKKPAGTVAYTNQVIVTRNNTVVNARYNGIQLEGSSQSTTIMYVAGNLSINNNQSGNGGAIALRTSIYMHNAERVFFDNNVAGDNQGTPTQAAFWAADSITNLYELNVRNVGALATTGLTGITNHYSGLSAMTGSIDDAQHGARGGGSLHALAVGGGNAGFMSGADKAKADQFNPATGKTLSVARTLTLDAGADGYTATIPATGTVALIDTAQTFTAQQTFNVAGGPVKIDGAPSTTRDIGYYSSNSLRWLLRTNNTTESGNSGSNFQIIARAGSTTIGAALTIDRATLAAVFGGEISATNLAITTGKVLNVARTITLDAGADGYTLTVPATGTAALLSRAQTFTAAQNIGVALSGFGAAFTSEVTGASGASSNLAIQGLNSNTGTAAGFATGGGYGFRPNGNVGQAGLVNGVTTGNNIALYGVAENGNTNIGQWGSSTLGKINAKSVGIAGFALNTASGGIHVGGLFMLEGTTFPTLQSAALLADNGSRANPVFLARVNGVVKVEINATGHLSLAEGVNLVAGTGTGSMIATGATQKLGFFGATPIARQALAANATDLASVITLANDIKAKLVALGLNS